MRVYVDVSAAVHRRAGLGRYAESLTRALYAAHPESLGVFFNREAGIEPLAGLDSLPTHSVAWGYKVWRMAVLLGQVAARPWDRLLPDATLFHATEHLLPPFRDLPTVLTVHDLIFRHLPQHHKPLNRWYLNLALPLFCRRATHIIAVSQATKRDLVAAYHLPPEKITVIHEAADPRFKPASAPAKEAVRRRYALPERFMLYVGTIEPRKNLVRLLRVWERLYRAGEVPPLVIAGKRGWLSDGFFAALEASPERQAVRLTGYVPDEDLPALYSAAESFVFPSVYEGFGLPPLEAMACGTPVVCANVSSLPEVVGEAALTCDPYDEASLAESLRRLHRDPALRQQLRERGLRQAARFSWARAAQETWEVYRHWSK